MKWVKIRQKSGKKIHLVASKIGKNKKKVKNAFADQKRRKKGEKKYILVVNKMGKNNI